jgi:hypothetical protein
MLGNGWRYSGYKVAAHIQHEAMQPPPLPPPPPPSPPPPPPPPPPQQQLHQHQQPQCMSGVKRKLSDSAAAISMAADSKRKQLFDLIRRGFNWLESKICGTPQPE